MTQSQKLKFNDLQRLPRGAANMPIEVNALPRELLKVAFDAGLFGQEQYKSLLLDLADIEVRKWYGTWKVANIHMTFRYGVCQSYLSIDKPLRASTFDLNDINKAVDFSKQTKGETHD